MDIRPLAWAFMFEGERCFEGTRTFSTQGIDKAVLNTFKLYAKLGHQRVELTSSRDQDPEQYADYWGEGKGAEIDGWATLAGTKSAEILLYCHEDTWESDGCYAIEFAAEGLPFGGPYKVTQWTRQGRPDYPQGAQYEAIKARDGLELLGPVQVVRPMDGKLKLSFDMPVKSVSLIIIEKAQEAVTI